MDAARLEIDERMPRPEVDQQPVELHLRELIDQRPVVRDTPRLGPAGMR